jgi:putative membrane protein
VSSASSQTPPTPSREPGVEDATRRTRLANERTYLAWWRTGLTSLAVAVGVGRLVPAHTNASKWPYETVGALFGLLGIGFIWFGFARARAVEDALDRASFAELGVRLPAALVAAGCVLGAAVVALILFA